DGGGVEGVLLHLILLQGGSQLGDGDTAAETTGEVVVDRRGQRLLAGLGGSQSEELGGDLLRGVDVDAQLLSGRDQDVVAAHQTGTGNPADPCLRQGDVLWPAGLGAPLRQDGVEGCLDLAVGAVATEHATVRGTRQDDVDTVTCTAGGQVGQTRDGALDGPEQQTCLVLGLWTGIRQVAGDRRCGEWVRQGRGQGRLGHGGGAADGDALLIADPVNDGVDIAVGG